MVSLRCKIVVEQELQKIGLHCVKVNLGTIEVEEDINASHKQELQKNLKRYGLELLDDKRNILTEKIKAVIIEMIHYSEDLPKVNYSGYISEKLGYDYTYLANTFSEVKGTTIQQYIINHKIERVKELLLYENMSLTEISYQLHYSSVGHLSSQFKKITGLTPSYFKSMKKKKLKNLEDL